MKLIPLCLTLVILPLSVAAQDAVPRDEHEMHRLHNDPKAYIGALEDPKRDAYQKPQEVMTALAIKPGEVIADIGAGSCPPAILPFDWRSMWEIRERYTQWT